MARLNTLLVLIALFGIGLLLYRQGGLNDRITAMEQAAHGERPAPEEEEGFEVAEVMGRLERHHAKWWLAGQAGHAELAAFYLHEMEEAMEELAHAGVVEENGVDVSALVGVYGMPVIHALEQRLEREGVAAMHADAAVLVANCNSCHAATGHGFIQVQVPVGATFPGQSMAP
jgi:hypothetical protein